jgi:thiamine biosynthesis lipoprotein
MAQLAWQLDQTTHNAKRLNNCPLSLNAIAKGYIVDRACKVALDRKQGIRGVLLNVGGDMRVCGDAVRRIGVANPLRDSETTGPISQVEIREHAIASSGNYQRGFKIGGKSYSHIFDPRTGKPVERVVGSTVIAERSVDADALATIFNVLSIEDSIRLADSLPEVACLLVSAEGRVVRNSAWKRFEKAKPSLVSCRQKAAADAPKAAPAATPWPKDYELLVNFEINRVEGNANRYRRPYVAVWVEDQDGVTVRTLTLWLQKTGTRWIPDLKSWYRDDQVRKLVDETNLVETISRATRPPGKYDIIWDGKDDQGNPLDAGTYTVLIEAAREHGTYQIIRKQVTLAAKPFAEELKGNAEIKSASLVYRLKKPAK